MLLAGHVIHGWQLKEIRYQIDSAFGRVQETDPDSGNHDPGQEMWQIDHGLHIFAVFRAPNFINQKRQHDRNREHEYDFHQADDNGILQHACEGGRAEQRLEVLPPDPDMIPENPVILKGEFHAVQRNDVKDKK